MYSDRELIKIWFYGFETIGQAGRRKMLELCGSIDEVFYSDKKIFQNILGKNQYLELSSYCSIEAMYKRVEKLTDRNIGIVHLESEMYPEKLKNIYDPPGLLYVKGRLHKSVYEKNRNIAIVGSRNADSYGIEMANMFARELAKSNINIISGLALGIDGRAHNAALDAGGYSLGVLGSGINVTYPKAHAELFYEMERRGGIISEHYLDVKPLAVNFPRRNRIISGLADGVLVVEAGNKSGSLITADFALEQGKQVYAVPGRAFDNNCEGTNNLIKQGAMCVTEPDDIIMDLLGTDAMKNINHIDISSDAKSVSVRSDLENCLAPVEKMVYSCLSLEPVYIDTIIEKIGITVTEAINSLYLMEKKGVIKQPARGYYIIAI